jgi:release factor glutamine methyltransferase
VIASGPPAPDTAALTARLRAAGCVFAEDEAALLTATASSAGELETLVVQRVSGTPLEHLLGWAEFRGLRVAVAPGVFVPRQRTGYLVEQAVARIRDRSGVPYPAAAGRGATPEPRVVLDLCCGSGALGLALATELAADGIPVELAAADIAPAAVECARRNLERLGARVYHGDLFAPLPPELAGRVDILLANTPYVPTAMIAHLPAEARDHEPRAALDGGPDGLDVFRRVTAQAPAWLAPGGQLLVESSREQVAIATKILACHGLAPQVAESDELEATVVIGIRTAAP